VSFDPVFLFKYVVCLLFFFFFFSSRRRHTRSKRDWSSDVCSSDLRLLKGVRSWEAGPVPNAICPQCSWLSSPTAIRQMSSSRGRSEERRVGKECRSRWWTEH